MPGIIGRSAGKEKTSLGIRTRYAKGIQINPINIDARKVAKAISTSRYRIKQKRTICPIAARIGT